MKKYTLIFTAAAAALFIGTSAYAQSTPTPTERPRSKAGCLYSSWNPESYSFYGAKDAIVEKLADIPAKLPERRVFLQVTQGDSSAEVKLYERQEDGTFTVTRWTPGQTSRLLAEIDKAIIANKGVNCVCEQVKAVLKKEAGKGEVSPPAAAPETPKAAFKHSVDQAHGEFIKSTVIILC